MWFSGGKILPFKGNRADCLYAAAIKNRSNAFDIDEHELRYIFERGLELVNQIFIAYVKFQKITLNLY